METEYHVTLFSNSSENFYNNKLSEFTNDLTPPLILKPLGKWKVGLTDLTHSYILNEPYQSSDDVIRFYHLNNTNLQLSDFIFYIVLHSKKPTIYTRSYFHDFLDYEKLKNFSTNETLNTYKKKLINPDSLESFTVNWEYARVKHNFKIHLNINYTGKEIFYIFVSSLVDFLNKYEKNKNLVNEDNFTDYKTKLIYGILNNTIDSIQSNCKLVSNSRIISQNAFFFVYSDCIQPRYVGDKFYNVLSVLPLKEVEHEYTAIKNVQYFTVNKEILNNISIKFADEYGRSIPIDTDFHPTCVNLHFKKDV